MISLLGVGEASSVLALLLRVWAKTSAWGHVASDKGTLMLLVCIFTSFVLGEVRGRTAER